MEGGLAPYQPKKRTTRRQKKNHCDLTTCLTLKHPALNYSSPNVGNNFYKWVNEKWFSDMEISPYDSTYGASEELEDCISRTTIKIIEDCVKHPSSPGRVAIEALHNSFIHHRDNIRNVDALRIHLSPIESIRSKDDLIREFGRLTRFGIINIFNFDFGFSANNMKIPLFLPDFPTLNHSLLHDKTTFDHYKKFISDLGKEYGLDNLEKSIYFERAMVKNLSPYLEQEDITCYGNGHTLAKKFSKIPWNTYFEELGLPNWRKMKFQYKYSKLLRKLSYYFDEIPLDTWKLYIYRLYLNSLAPYLPSAYSTIYFKFKGVYFEGREKKSPPMDVLSNFIYDYVGNTFSKFFWDSCGDTEVVDSCKDMTKIIVKATRDLLKGSNWLRHSTKIAAVDKLNAMKFMIGRPAKWDKEIDIPLDREVFINNVFILGDALTKKQFSMMFKNDIDWTQGIFRVNAYYYEQLNHIIIPYGILGAPFYEKGEGTNAWNYGSIGFTIGHEICHGFDNDGKRYDANGKEKVWWTKYDNRQYNKKTDAIIKLYESQKILGKRLDGESTLGENIADLGGIEVSLEALKYDMKQRGVTKEKDMIQEYRTYFISYATSWRTYYRYAKLKTSMQTDVHSPAILRVNMTVPHFQEWYDAFNVKEDAELYIPPEKRIRFFN